MATGPTHNSPSVICLLCSRPSTEIISSQTSANRGKRGNSTKWHNRKRRRHQRQCSLPTAAPLQQSHISSTWDGSYRLLIMTGRKWYIILGRHGVGGRGCHECWEGRGYMLRYRGFFISKWFRWYFFKGRICGLCLHALGRLWAASTIGWYSDWWDGN